MKPTHPDELGYCRFTGPQRLDKLLNSLMGVLEGISVDGEISAQEMKSLRNWLSDNSALRTRHPFDEIYSVLQEAVSQGSLDDEVISDVQWLCRHYQQDSVYFDALTADMQQLHGHMAGLIMDGVITKAELKGLRSWMSDHEHLRRCWPYDEVDSLITAVLKDGRIDDQEHKMLLSFFADFLSYKDHRAICATEVATPTRGLCAVCPELQFQNHVFCFTGHSCKCTRMELAAIVEQRGGRFARKVVRDLDYLVVGAEGNAAWAYACYGRKVEQAVELRKTGLPILIVHELDFWDKVAEGPEPSTP